MSAINFAFLGLNILLSIKAQHETCYLKNYLADQDKFFQFFFL